MLIQSLKKFYPSRISSHIFRYNRFVHTSSSLYFHKNSILHNSNMTLKRTPSDQPALNGAPLKRQNLERQNSNILQDQEPPAQAASDTDQLQDLSMDDQSDIESLNISPISNDSIASGEWRKTIDKVIKSVVSIHFAQTASFDCDASLVSEATGFIVDAENGIILTNRHVVGAGPFSGYAIFDNHEEVFVKPIYRDPVHDFGFLKFDPKKLKYMEVQQLELKPELATVGCEIRVVGNDAGEKLSILAGFISRLDRNAPEYGGLTYNDFNTEYIQAAASASGGSSGSPVVDINGYAVALQAGGSSEASTDFFLPLYRIKRALKCVQNNEPITRGTIQVQWTLKPFDECRRLGLSSEVETKFRQTFPKIIGLLVAEVILPEGPADGLIEEGDTLVSINGEEISTFIKVDDIFDSSIDQNVEIVVQRGGENVVINLKVGDLHKITPNRYLEVAGASFNDMSYQMARIYSIPVKGVFINSARGSFIVDKNDPVGWVIETLNDIDIKDLDHLIEVMKEVPDRSRISITARHITDLHSPVLRLLYIDRHWYSSFRLATRNDETGLWDFETLGDPLPPVKLTPKNVKFVDIPIEYPECAQLSKSFVLVVSYIHVPVDSFPFTERRSYALVIDASKGYVLVSRNIVPHDCVDIQITVADSVTIPAEVIFLHPTQNYAIIKYDTSLIENSEVLTPKFSRTPLKRGDKAVFIGYNYNERVIFQSTKVSDIATVNVPRNVTTPRYRASNLEIVSFDTTLANDCSSGVLVDQDGTVRAFWLSFLGDNNGENETVYKMGIDVTKIPDLLSFQNGDINPTVRIVDSEFYAIPISQARVRGVSDEWIQKIESSGKDRLQFITVSRATCPEGLDSSSKKSILEPGDVVLSVDGQTIYGLNDITSHIGSKESLDLKIVRRKKELDLKVPTVEVQSTNHLVFWCGAVLQAPHHAVRQAIVKLPSEVYITSMGRGSPARAYGISHTNFITHVNGIPTPNLTEFVKVVKTIPDETYCKLRLVSFDNTPYAISIKTSYHYFPTGELKREDGTWIDIEYDENNKESNVNEVKV